MVENSIREATGSLDSKLAELNRVLTDSALDQSCKNQNDDHMRQDVEGIRKALRGDYKEAAKILSAESQVNGSVDVRKVNNGLIAMANTMYAVSLIKLDRLPEAESLLKSEIRHELAGDNNVIHVKELNKRALRVALLKQGKNDQVRYLDMIDEIMGAAQIHGLTTKWLNDAIACKDTQIKQAALDMAKKQSEMLHTSDDARRRQLMQEQTDLCHSSNADEIMKLQTQGIQAALDRKNASAEQYFKAAFNVIDQDDSIRLPGPRDNSKIHHVDPEYTQVASSLYAFALAEQGKYLEAEQRFAREVERDRKGLNTADSTVKQLNEYGLEYVRLKLGKIKVAHRTTQEGLRPVSIMMLQR